MKGKKSFVLYCDLMDIVHDLSDEEAGKLIKIIVDFVNDKNPETNDRILNLAWKPIKNALKSDLKRWEAIKEKRSEYGKLGGLAKASKSHHKLPNAKQNLANLPVSVSVSVSDNVINKDSHNEIFKSLSNSGQWIESVCMSLKCSSQELKSHLNTFRLECINKEEFKKDEKDAKTHFINWVKKGNPIPRAESSSPIILEKRTVNRNPQ